MTAHSAVDTASSWPAPDRDAATRTVTREIERIRAELPRHEPPMSKMESADLGDRAEERLEAERQVAHARRLRRRLADLEATLERLDDGTWGTCQQCGRAISTDRLDVIVTTSTCQDHGLT